MRKEIIRKIPRNVLLSKFPGKKNKTEHGLYKEHVVGETEYFFAKIDSNISGHYLKNSDEKLMIISGYARFSFGDDSENKKQQIKHMAVVCDETIIERSVKTAWKIDLIDTPLIVRGIITPPYKIKDVVNVKIGNE